MNACGHNTIFTVWLWQTSPVDTEWITRALAPRMRRCKRVKKRDRERGKDIEIEFDFIYFVSPALQHVIECADISLN